MKALSTFLVVVLLFACNSENPLPVPPDHQVQKRSKAEEISAMAQYEWELTHDPQTGRIPSELLREAKQELEKRRLTSQQRSRSDGWKSIGPKDLGGRTRTVRIDAADASGNTVFAGSVSGGLYRTTNFMSVDAEWHLVESFEENLAVNTIFQDPQDPSSIYVGTGEGWFNGDASRGAGIFKSTDGGASWRQLRSTSGFMFWWVNDIVMDLNGNLYASTKHHGVQRSTDEGETWTEVLGVNVGNSNSERGADLELGPDGDLYATSGLFSIGSVHKADFSLHGPSTGEIDSWEEITPGDDFRRMEIAVAPSDPDRLYVLGEADKRIEGAFRSDDGGSSWEELPIATRATDTTTNFGGTNAWWDLILAVDPVDADVVYAGGIDLVKSTDGGESWKNISTTFASDANGYESGQVVHADQHDIHFFFGDQNKAIFANDGGTYLSTNLTSASITFEQKTRNYTTSQFYSCCVWPDVFESQFFLGGTQDNGTRSVNTDDDFVEIKDTRFWHSDGGYCYIADNPSQYIMSTQGIQLLATLDNGANFNYFFLGLDRGSFINPYTFDEESETIYGALEGGKYFIIDSIATGGTIDSTSIPEFEGAQISAITADPNHSNRLWVGLRPYFNNGAQGRCRVLRIDDAHDDSPTITDFTDDRWNQNNAPRNIFIDKSDPDFMMITFSNFNISSVYITRDGGESWIDVNGNLPNMPVRWGVINPINPNELIVATDLGILSTTSIEGDDTRWFDFQPGLPTMRYNMLDIRESDQLLLAASYGRGLFTSNYELDQSRVIASFAQDVLELSESQGGSASVNACGDSVLTAEIPIVLNRSAESDMSLLIEFSPDADDTVGVTLPPAISLGAGGTEFSPELHYVDDRFEGDAQEFSLTLSVMEGNLVIDQGEMRVTIRDNERSFLGLQVEGNLATVTSTVDDGYRTQFATERAMAIVTPDGLSEESCASVSVATAGDSSYVPEWMMGFSILEKTFSIVANTEQPATYNIEFYISSDELAELIASELRVIRADVPLTEVAAVDEIEHFADTDVIRLGANLYQIRIATGSLGYFGFTNAPDLMTVSAEDAELSHVKVFPNPFQDRLQIRFGNRRADHYSCQIYNAGGQIVQRRSNAPHDLSTSSWPSGNYYLVLQGLNSTHRRVYKLLKM